jgi:hypothetical protein
MPGENPLARREKNKEVTYIKQVLVCIYRLEAIVSSYFAPKHFT